MSCWSIHVKRFAPVLLDASEASFFLKKKIIKIGYKCKINENFMV
jgi:hypothetical protein